MNSIFTSKVLVSLLALSSSLVAMESEFTEFPDAKTYAGSKNQSQTIRFIKDIMNSGIEQDYKIIFESTDISKEARLNELSQMIQHKINQISKEIKEQVHNGSIKESTASKVFKNVLGSYIEKFAKTLYGQYTPYTISGVSRVVSGGVSSHLECLALLRTVVTASQLPFADSSLKKNIDDALDASFQFQTDKTIKFWYGATYLKGFSKGQLVLPKNVSVDDKSTAYDDYFRTASKEIKDIIEKIKSAIADLRNSRQPLVEREDRPSDVHPSQADQNRFRPGIITEEESELQPSPAKEQENEKEQEIEERNLQQLPLPPLSPVQEAHSEEESAQILRAAYDRLKNDYDNYIKYKVRNEPQYLDGDRGFMRKVNGNSKILINKLNRTITSVNQELPPQVYQSVILPFLAYENIKLKFLLAQAYRDKYRNYLGRYRLDDEQEMPTKIIKHREIMDKKNIELGKLIEAAKKDYGFDFYSKYEQEISSQPKQTPSSGQSSRRIKTLSAQDLENLRNRNASG